MQNVDPVVTSKIKQLLTQYHENNLIRERITITERQQQSVLIQDKPIINFSSNDYLGLSKHPQIINAFIQGAYQFGIGSTASPVVSGYTRYHSLLEKTFADFFEREQALLFNSGYHANLGVLSTFANRNSVIIADKHCHASLVDGALLSKANLLRYKHQSYQHAAFLMQKTQYQEGLVVSESVHSTHGSINDLSKLAQLTSLHNKLLVVDDAHGIGVLGATGRGASEHFQLTQQQLPCLITPLGKTFGAMGAVASGKKEIIESLLQFARSYRYSTALPPALCKAMLTGIAILKKETWRRTKLQNLSHFFIEKAQSCQLKLIASDLTPIKSILLKSNQQALAMQKYLLHNGFLVSCMRPPTVPKNQTCIRISLNCMHSESHINQLLDLIAEYWHENLHHRN